MSQWSELFQAKTSSGRTVGLCALIDTIMWVPAGRNSVVLDVELMDADHAVSKAEMAHLRSRFIGMRHSDLLQMP